MIILPLDYLYFVNHAYDQLQSKITMTEHSFEEKTRLQNAILLF